MRDMKIYTATEVAQQLGLTHGRIRQICRWEKIGKKFGSTWMLTSDDIKKIRQRFKNSKIGD